MRDAELLPRVQACAERLLGGDAAQVTALTARWIGPGERYGRVG
jgi:hypothetical protein